uniref:Derlin n=1 Tax=Strigamia maritima TaxID=126957 RepID=T1IJ07_STRMM
MSEISNWFQSVPLLTRYWLGASIVFPVLGRLGLLNAMDMLLLYQPLVYRFQIWRPLTALVYYPITPMTGFHYLTNLYFLYNYSSRLETGTFFGRQADYAYMLLIMAICNIALGLAFTIPLLMDPMVLAVLYVWCQLNRDVIMNFWFGTQFKAMYLPWVVLLFNMVITGSFMNELLGIFVGHTYFFLQYKYPLDFGGRRFLNTPAFLYFPNNRGTGGNSGQMPASRQQNAAVADNSWGSHRWGRGHT